MINIGLENFVDQEQCSIESLMIDYIESEESFYNDQLILDSVERLEFIRNYVSEHGINDTIEEMIGDQISYNSTEELIAKLDASIEGILSKITGDTIDNTLKQIKQFADYLSSSHTISSVKEGQKIRFIDLSEANPIAAFIAGVGETFESYAKGKLKSDRAPTPEEMNDFVDKLKNYIHTGNMILRSMKTVDMTPAEYHENHKKLIETAREIKSKFRTLELAKLLCPKSSTAGILNKLMKNSAQKEDNVGKKTYDLIDKNKKVNARYNSLIRAILRIIKIIVAKGYTLVIGVSRGAQNVGTPKSENYDPKKDYSRKIEVTDSY